MNYVRVKPGVRFDVIAPAGFHIIAALVEVAATHHVDLVITSGTDAHQPPDPHALGEAYDISVAGMTADMIVILHRSLGLWLGPGFTVLYEVPVKLFDKPLAEIAYVNPKATAPHIHLQPRNGFTFAAPQVLHA